MSEPYTITPEQLDKKSRFKCPKCKNRIDPEDYTSNNYIIEGIIMDNNMTQITILCKKCGSIIKLQGEEKR